MTPKCHPDRPHRALGFCQTCYHRYYYRARKALGRPLRGRQPKRETDAQRIRRRLEGIAA